MRTTFTTGQLSVRASATIARDGFGQGYMLGAADLRDLVLALAKRPAAARAFPASRPLAPTSS